MPYKDIYLEYKHNNLEFLLVLLLLGCFPSSNWQIITIDNRVTTFTFYVSKQTYKLDKCLQVELSGKLHNT